jgi:hypothetical protein
MESKLFLTFKDKSLNKPYYDMRRNEINIVSTVLLISRLIFTINVVINNTLNNHLIKLSILHALGPFLHLIILILSWKIPLIF